MDGEGRRDHAQPLFGLPGGRHTIGIARHWHFIFDILFAVNGVAYVALLFATSHYLKLIPVNASILPDAGSCIVQYSALHLPPAPGGYFRFDANQMATAGREASTTTRTQSATCAIRRACWPTR